jgi:hypothetical protein
VIGATIAVPEAVVNWTHNSLGGPAILLIAGAVLVGASALGLWLRSVHGPEKPAASGRHQISG